MFASCFKFLKILMLDLFLKLAENLLKHQFFGKTFYVKYAVMSIYTSSA